MSLRVMSMAAGLLSALTMGHLAQAQEVFVWADAAEPTTVDPAKVNVNHEMTIARNVFDRLVNYDLKQPDKLLPGLATSWKQDGTKWTFTLRDGVKFHDGTPFDAEDVKATIERDLRIGQGQSYLIADIDKVTVVDPKTVEIETKAPNVFLAGNLARSEIMSAEDIAKHASEPDKGDAYFNENANGTGPYKMVSWTRGAQIDLERNKDWWGTFPDKAYDRVIDRFVTEGSNRARGLEGGEYDLANFVPRDEALRIGKSPGFTLVEGNNLWAWPAIYLNSTLAPTDNADFRDALTKVYDYNAMNQYFQGSSVTPRGPVPAWVPGSPENDMAPIQQDVEKAKAALEKAGVTNPTMKCSVPSEFTEFAFAATVLQASAAQIGITVEIELLPFVEAITAAKSNKSNCFIIGNANLSPTDPTKFFAAHYLTGGFYNAANYSNPELDALVAKIPTITDDKERYEALKKAAEMVVDSHTIIWTARPTTVVPVPDHVQGYQIDPAEYINVRLWELHEK
ncbi:ABC transporter substrate-binding protein [Rhodoligotrophos defluvii]|uniref:ABC transporter substrate-binding protein n=1 Tax=Rhodoligotrophos defluvii TaxID=2561934 RepID=UPI001EF02FA9|nr:ABC transporter substrate-binding protein [Rhodoligotrophos defluvii]